MAKRHHTGPIMTKLPGVPDRVTDVRPGMASYLGSGPYGKTCGSCKNRGYFRAGKGKFNAKTGLIEERRVKTMGCKMYLVLTHKHGPPVFGEWAACKYYEESD